MLQINHPMTEEKPESTFSAPDPQVKVKPPILEQAVPGLR
jgi:hypothetical protein